MALDAKAIKEEIPDKDVYEPSARHNKGKDQIRTPDSPESARAIAPRSPISPHIPHHSSNTNSLIPPPPTTRSLPLHHNARCISPIINGSNSPPLTTPGSIQESSRLILKLKRFLGALVKFGQDTNCDNGDRVRSLTLSLASGGLTADEYKVALQEIVNFPLRPYVIPYLKSNIPLLQREISNLARASNQSTQQYVRLNESSVLDFVHNSAEHVEIFLPIDAASCMSGSSSGSNILKRRTSDSFYDLQPGSVPNEWNEYLMIPPPKRSAQYLLGSSGHIFPPNQSQTAQSAAGIDYQIVQPQSAHIMMEPLLTSIFDKNNLSHRDDRCTDINRSTNSNGYLDSHRHTSTSTNRQTGSVPSASCNGTATNSGSGEEEWKNIHTMLSCVSAMVDKTKRAITILQQRGIETPQPPANHSNVHQMQGSHQTETSILSEIKRQTEERVAEFRRNAEEAVNHVKRQAIIEIQRAVVAAENRAIEMMAQERNKIEKIFSEMAKNNTEEVDSQLAAISGSQNACWNCGRKANETCSGCNLARYCGSFCQHKDWEQHHQICGNTRIETLPAQSTAGSTSSSSSTSTINLRSVIPVPPARLSPSAQSPVATVPSAVPSGSVNASASVTAMNLPNGINCAGQQIK